MISDTFPELPFPTPLIDSALFKANNCISGKYDFSSFSVSRGITKAAEKHIVGWSSYLKTKKIQSSGAVEILSRIATDEFIITGQHIACSELLLRELLQVSAHILPNLTTFKTYWTWIAQQLMSKDRLAMLCVAYGKPVLLMDGLIEELEPIGRVGSSNYYYAVDDEQLMYVTLKYDDFRFEVSTPLDESILRFNALYGRYSL